MNYENWLSYRYLVSSKGRFLTFLNVISIAGVAIGVTALIVVIGVMEGFGNNLREKIIGSAPHVMVEQEVGIAQYSEVVKKLEQVEGVHRASPYIQGSIFLEEAGQATGVAIRGIDPQQEQHVTKVDEYLTQGNLGELEAKKVIVGHELARYFGLRLGDTITLISPGSGISTQKWRFKLEISGIFKTGMSDYDRNLILVSLDQAQEIFGLDEGTSTGIGVSLADPGLAQETKENIYKAIGYSFLVRTWIDVNQNLFEALFLEKWGLFIVLTLMVLVASFNIISTLIVMVTSKVHDIGILKSIGATKASIRRIFTKQGLFIGSLGIAWGLIGGFGLSYILKTYVKVPQDIYSIDRVPIDIQMNDVLIIVSAALIISYLASIYPAIKAANLEPVDALRYE